MLAPGDRTNFDTLIRAMGDDAICLMEVQRVADGKPVAAICAVSWDGSEFAFTPFAVMVEGDPFELFLPPNPDGGFHSIDEVHG